ncbi:hypothetical protein AB0M39_38145 [Streptomyces sp. NPDC051907]
MAQALDDISRRTRERWHGMRYDDPSPEAIAELTSLLGPSDARR